MPNEKKPLVQIAAAWEMPSGKGYSGRFGNARMVIFKNVNKKNPKEPDLRILVQEQDREQRPAPAATAATAPSENKDEELLF